MNTNELYQQITNEIIDLMEGQLTGNFDKPWIDLDVDSKPAHNTITGNIYQGINQLILSNVRANKGYLKGQWMTFNQITSMDAKVLKGSRAVPVVFYQTSFKDAQNRYLKPEVVKKMGNNEKAERGIESIPTMRLYHVFNIYQTQGLPEEYYRLPEADLAKLTEFEKDQKAEDLISATGAHIQYVPGNKAYYNPLADIINLPVKEQFNNNAGAFYAVALHELGHWTGRTSRLNRLSLGHEFGSPGYSFEELIAELTSAFLTAGHLGFTKEMNRNASYLKSWIEVLKSDPKAIFKAAAQAQKSANYLIALSKGDEPMTANANEELINDSM